MADGFIWYEHVTNDVDKAARFYEKVTGWETRDSGMPGIRYLLFGKDGKDVGGMMAWSAIGAPARTPEWMGHIHTAALDKELKDVAADGGSILKPATQIPGIGRFAVVQDPQKAMYMLFEPGRGEAPPRLGQAALGNVGWHELMTGDAEKAFAYYAKHYGWQKDQAHDMGAMGVYQTFRSDQPLSSGGVMSMKNCPQLPKDTPPHWTFYFNVASADDAEGRIVEAGGRVVMPPMDVPGGSRILQALDDQGGHFALVQGPASK